MKSFPKLITIFCLYFYALGGHANVFDINGDQACFYDQINYQGTEYCYLSGEVSELDVTTNNIFKSVRIPSNFEVFAFNYSNYSGTMEIYSQDDPQLILLSSNIESLKIYDLTIRQFDPQVQNTCFYTQPNYQGAEFCYGIGDHPQFESILKNLYRSVRIPQHVEVFGFNYSNYSGTMEIYSEDTAEINTLNESLESLKVYDLSVRQFDPLIHNTCFYTQPNYQGAEFCYGLGDHPQFESILKNLYRSVRIPQHVEVFGFNYSNYSGMMEIYSEDMTDITALSQNLESLKVFDLSVRQFDPLIQNTCFYTQPNYQGAEFCYGLGHHPQFESILKNLYRSVRIPQHVEVFGFNYSNYSGTMEIYSEDTADITALSQNLESLKVYDLSMRQFDPQVQNTCFYTQSNYQGAEFCYGLGDHPQFESILKNLYRSVRIPQHVEVFGFNYSNYSGTMEIYSEDMAEIINLSQNLESLKVYDLSVRQFAPQVQNTCFYTQPNYQGAEFCYGIGEHASFDNTLRNLFQSVRVPANAEVFGFNSSNYNGTREIYSSDTADIAVLSQNLESLKVYGLSVRQFDPAIQNTCFYTQPDYQGAEFCYGIGDHPQFESILKNLYRSVRVPQDVEVFGFNYSNYSGTMEIYSEDTVEIINLSQNLESLKVYDLSVRQFDPLIQNTCFYTQPDYQGAEFCYGLGDHPQFESILKNLYRSVRIPQQVEVFGFNYSNYSGTREIYSSDTADIAALNENLESLKVYNLSARQFNPAIQNTCFYTQPDYQGAEFCYGIGDHPQFESILKNLYRSVRVPQDVEVFGFNYSNYSGTMEIYSEDTVEIINLSQNLESLKVYDLSVRQFDPLIQNTCFYTQPNYQGAEFCYDLGDHPQFESILKNLYRSVRIPQQLEVFGFNYSNYSGTREIYSSDTADIAVLNKNIESLKIYDLSVRQFNPASTTACFYTQTHYQGAEFCYTVGDHLQLGKILDNLFESLKVPQNIEVSIYNYSNLTGSSLTYSADATALGTLGKKVSSLQVIQTDTEIDSDGDGISDHYEIELGTDPYDANSTPPDLDGDGIPNTVDDDRDGDGFNNDVDSFPDDHLKAQLVAIQNFQTAQQGTGIRLNWDAHLQSIVQGYLLYRADYDQQNWILLDTSGPVSGLEYLDTTVNNALAYDYQVVAVDGRNIEGIRSFTSSQFILYNNTQLSNAQSQWENFQVKLNWDYALQANETFRLYRREGANKAVIYEGIAAQFIDNSSYWSQAQSYELVSILTVTNPITSTPVEREGPPLSLTLNALEVMTAQLLNATSSGVNSFQIEEQTDGQLAITGRISNATTAVQISLTNSQGVTTTQSIDGNFQFVVRDPALEQMTLYLIETGAPTDRAVVLDLTITPDLTPLMLTLDTGAGIITSESIIVISGQAMNADTGLQEISAANNRYPEQSFALILLENNMFSGEIPLKTGENLVTVTALGLSTQTAQVSTNITRQANVIPSVEITSHQNNQVVSTQQINLQGLLYTSLDIAQLQLRVGTQLANISAIADQVYQFDINNINLDSGFNRLLIHTQTTAGSVETALVIYYQQVVVQPVTPLELILVTPFENQIVNEQVLMIKGQLFHAEEGASVSVNGVSALLYGDSSNGYSFNSSLDLTGMQEGPLSLDLIANSPDKDPVSKNIMISIDNQAPVITINNALSDTPQLNEVREQPYIINGTVVDANLSSVLINGQSLVLQPNGNNGYLFEAGIELNAGEQATLSIVASDAAGNSSQLEYQLLSNPQVELEVIEPLAGTQYRSTGSTHDIPFIVRLNGLTGGEILLIRTGTSEQSYPLTQAIIDGNFTVNTAETIDKLHIEVQSDTAEVLISTDIAISLVNLDSLSLSLQKTSPARNSKDHQPHHPIQFYFNKPVALADLAVSVKQTYHGSTYQKLIDSGASQSKKYKGEVTEVHFDQAPVSGGLSLLPGEQIVEFYPDNDISFGARVFVGISHQGIELDRFIYNIRSNPTYIHLLVTNQENQPLEGIKVSIPELQKENQTDSTGYLSLNGQGTQSDTIQSNLYRILINPDQANPQYGTNEKVIQLDNGRVNDIGSIAIPALNSAMPYRHIRSSASQNVLVGGDLIIDTSLARLEFADGNDKGSVHVQIINFGENIFRAGDIELSPLWVFNLQPGPIQVTGPIGLRIKMPRLYGSFDYIPAENTLVLLMGQETESLTLKPIGVGKIINNTVVSQGTVNAERLDYLGYTLVNEEQQLLLQDYLDNSINLQQLNASLTR